MSILISKLCSYGFLGIGTALIFLPPGATAIVMNYYDTVRKTSVQVRPLRLL